MKKTKWGYLWILPLLFMLMPMAYAMMVGFWVIYRDWRLIFVLLVLVLTCSVLTWGLSVWWVRRRMALVEVHLKEEAYWSRLEKTAAAEVERYLEEVDVQGLDLAKTQTLLPHFQEILHRVARVYHPEKKSPELDIPVSDVLIIAERVTQDVREFITENIPGSHLLTLHDLKYIRTAVGWSQPAYNAYRVISVPINPISAFFRETQAYFTRKFTESVLEKGRETLIRYVFCQVGRYAVELYSGRLRMEYLQESGQWTSATAEKGDLRNLKENQVSPPGTALAGGAHEDAISAVEPLRVLVAGQPKSGKTSLIQALFPLKSALPDPVLRETGVQRYLISERDERVLVCDSAGYETQNTVKKRVFPFPATEKVTPFEMLREEVEHADVILLVCDVNMAAREADRLFVDALRAWAQENPQKMPPLLLLVMTGIDRLRPFLEWNPPFNVKTPATEKERNIAQAVEVLTQALALDDSIPVIPVCLNPERVYNVEETLRPILADIFENAKCVRDSRLLSGFYTGRRWKETASQLAEMGGRLWNHLRKKKGGDGK